MLLDDEHESEDVGLGSVSAMLICPGKCQVIL